MNASRVLAASGLWGALLTVVILAMSVLLRLGTQLHGGEALSILPPALEQSARIAHRAAAMAVGILAALALVAAWRARADARPSAWALALVVALTVLLAVVGRHTAGYRVDFITVVNVAGGIALAAAFWALRSRAGERADAVALAALALLVALAALGAAADAATMRGTRAFGPLHLLVATIFTGLALWAAWRTRGRRVAAAATALLALSQFGLGFALLASRGARPLAAGWLHAMLACALALLLASLAFGRRAEHPA